MISLLGKFVCDKENLLEKSIHRTEMMKFLRTICKITDYQEFMNEIFSTKLHTFDVIFSQLSFKLNDIFFNFNSLTRQQRDKTHMYIYRRNFMLNKIRVRLNLENSMWNLLYFIFYFFASIELSGS